ncbi:hypothetical protein K9L67_02640 [Candidatus Woesearchaeota archaeon]|nr:hypothetical protein [Candidatus Woesearchaeota archaeon]MCF7901102.1 hypothetical protein [Candidatus Woesearchaeota archaeon]MCF8013435.1 hypothetical protein [Candidatus Woesearchaeota archaeon]
MLDLHCSSFPCFSPLRAYIIAKNVSDMFAIGINKIIMLIVPKIIDFIAFLFAI